MPTSNHFRPPHFFRLLVIGILLTSCSLLPTATRAIDPVEELQNQINELEKMKKQSEDATKPLEQQATSLSQRVKNAQSGIDSAKKNAGKLAVNITQREDDLADTIALFSYRVSERYKRSKSPSPFMIFFAQGDLQNITRDLAYKASAQDQDKSIIQSTAQDIINLQTDKKKLEDDQKKLAALQITLNEQKKFFDVEISKAKTYQSEVSGKIASLTAQQQQIIASKAGTATTSVGEVPEGGDPKSLPSYNPGFSPAFAVFSFGAPHFKGMSQYGAKGRAESGQSYEQILKAYYGDVEIKDVSMPDTVATSVGTMPFENQYLKGIAEMPGSWNSEALKAQAIAARTYALSYLGWRMGNQSLKGSICVTEACQVYKSSKFQAGGAWHDAVNATKGKVLVSKATGDVFSTMYASTAGGHLLGYTSVGHSVPGLWDSTSDWSNWTDGAYEKKGGSPWFYKAWYTTRGGDTCGKDSPWLRENEMADILNAWVVRKAGGGDADKVGPLGPCWGSDSWSIDEMKSRADSKGGAYSSISSVKVEHSSAGTTSSVVFQTNRGELRMSSSEFKEIFNLRAPGRISLKSNLYGIERK